MAMTADTTLEEISQKNNDVIHVKEISKDMEDNESNQNATDESDKEKNLADIASETTAENIAKPIEREPDKEKSQVEDTEVVNVDEAQIENISDPNDTVDREEIKTDDIVKDGTTSDIVNSEATNNDVINDGNISASDVVNDEAVVQQIDDDRKNTNSDVVNDGIISTSDVVNDESTSVEQVNEESNTTNEIVNDDNSNVVNDETVVDDERIDVVEGNNNTDNDSLPLIAVTNDKNETDPSLTLESGNNLDMTLSHDALKVDINSNDTDIEDVKFDNDDPLENLIPDNTSDSLQENSKKDSLVTSVTEKVTDDINFDADIDAFLDETDNKTSLEDELTQFTNDIHKSSPLFSDEEEGDDKKKKRTVKESVVNMDALAYESEFLTRRILEGRDQESYLQKKVEDKDRRIETADNKVKDLQLRLIRLTKDDAAKDRHIAALESELKEINGKVEDIFATRDKDVQEGIQYRPTNPAPSTTTTQKQPKSKFCTIL